MMSLRVLVEKTQDAEIFREMIGLAATPGYPQGNRVKKCVTRRSTAESMVLL